MTGSRTTDRRSRRAGAGEGPASFGRLLDFVAPRIPSWTWLAATIQLDLWYIWKILLDHLVRLLGLRRMPALPLNDHAWPLRTWRRRRDFAARTDQHLLVTIPKPVPGPVDDLVPHDGR